MTDGQFNLMMSGVILLIGAIGIAAQFWLYRRNIRRMEQDHHERMRTYR